MTDQDPIPDLQILMAEFSRSGLMTLHVRHDEFEILLSNDPGVGSIRNGASPSAAPCRAAPPAVLKAPATKPAAARPADVAELPADATVVKAPNLGTFYRAPKPGADDYVQIGSVITVGQEVCLIEVMKLFTAVRSDYAGRVHAVLAEDGAMVEAGQPLFALVPN